jgi:hypothetical protein
MTQDNILSANLTPQYTPLIIFIILFVPHLYDTTPMLDGLSSHVVWCASLLISEELWHTCVSISHQPQSSTRSMS